MSNPWAPDPNKPAKQAAEITDYALVRTGPHSSVADRQKSALGDAAVAILRGKDPALADRLQNARSGQSGVSPQDIADFRSAVEQHVLPVAEALNGIFNGGHRK